MYTGVNCNNVHREFSGTAPSVAAEDTHFIHISYLPLKDYVQCKNTKENNTQKNLITIYTAVSL